MTHLDTEITDLKASLIEMWRLVLIQLNNSREAIEKFDKNIAKEVFVNEKLVDAFELKINMDCENILALFNPVANDLRLVLAVLRINSDLERVGDYARSLARMVYDAEKPYEDELIKKTKILEMFDVGINMLTCTLESFENENNKFARTVFKTDDELDKTNKNSTEIIAKLIKKHPSLTINCLHLYTAIRRIERIGDQTKNIAEEIVFYLEAKVLRHKKKKEKLEE
jgi:phosphate transport system protein